MECVAINSSSRVETLKWEWQLDYFQNIFFSISKITSLVFGNIGFVNGTFDDNRGVGWAVQQLKIAGDIFEITIQFNTERISETQKFPLVGIAQITSEQLLDHSYNTNTSKHKTDAFY